MIIGRNVVIFLVLIGGCIGLQVWLSGQTNKWLGLILPGITLLYSLFATLGNLLYLGESFPAFFVSCLMVFILTNIPTLILLAIYAARREKFKRRGEMAKMQIQDLE